MKETQDAKMTKKQKAKKCKYCKGSGWVQVATNARGIKPCPYCQEGKSYVRSLGLDDKNDK